MVDALQNVINAITKSAMPSRTKLVVTDELTFVREAVGAGILVNRKKLKVYRTKLYAVIDAIYEVYEQYALPSDEANGYGKALGDIINRLIMPRATPHELDVRDRALVDKHIERIKKVEVANAKYLEDVLEAESRRVEKMQPKVTTVTRQVEKTTEELARMKITKEGYLQHKASGYSEEKIVEKYGFKSPYYLDKWKEVEGISKSDVEAAKDVNNLNCSDGFSIIPKEVEAEEEAVNSETESAAEDELALETESTSEEESASEAVVEPGAEVTLEAKAGSEADEPEDYAETHEVNEVQENVELEYPYTPQVVKLLVATGVEIELANRDFRLRGKDDYVDCVVHAATRLFSDKQITSKQLIDTLANYK